MKRWTVLAVLAGFLVATSALADDDPRLRVTGTTLADFEQKLFGQAGQQGQPAQPGLAQGTTPFEARFRDLTLTQADQQKLLQDLQKLNNLPEGSRVRLRGQIDGRPFRAEVRNHEGELRVELRGVRFASQQDAQTFVNSLRQGGAERIRVRGVLANGQRFDARFRIHDGRVEQRFRVKQPENEPHGTMITSASGRSQVEGARVKPEHEMENEHARRFDNDHGRKFNDAGRRSMSDSGRDFSGSDKSFSGASSGSSGKSGHGGHGKD